MALSGRKKSQKIRDEIKNIKPELIEKLRRGARNEFNTRVFDTVKKKREDVEKAKIRREGLMEKLKGKRQGNRVTPTDRKQSLKDKLEALKEKKAGAQKNPLRKRNPSGAMSL